MGGNIRETLEKEGLEVYQDEYKDLAAIFQNIDAKAQGMVTTGGIFLAGTFAFLNAASFRVEDSAKPFFMLALLLLISSVVLAVFAIHVRETVGPPSGDQVREIVGHLFRLSDEEIESKLSQYYGERAGAWAECLRHLKKVIKSKANLVWLSQLALLLGIVMVAAVILIKIS